MTAEIHAPVEVLIDRVRPGFSSDELAEALERVLERHKPVDTAALTPADQAFWDQHSGIADDPALASHAMAAAVAAAAIHEASSLGSDAVALRLVASSPPPFAATCRIGSCTRSRPMDGCCFPPGSSPRTAGPCPT